MDPNPTIMSYNASAVRNYNKTSGLVRFWNTISFFQFEKAPAYECSMFVQRSDVIVYKYISRRIGS
jgi:hypothetical protein